VEEPVALDAIGFGALNLDEFWEVSEEFLRVHDLNAGEEYVRDVEWFHQVYPCLRNHGTKRAVDPGGSAANMIAALYRMGFETGFWGVTGEADEVSLRMEELGRPENLRILTVPYPAGRCLAFVQGTDQGRDRTLVILPNANDLAGSRVPDLEYFGQAKWVHITSFVSQSVIAAQATVAESLSPHTRLSFDPGAVYCRHGIEKLTPVLKYSSVLFITGKELTMLTSESDLEAAVSILLELGVETVVVKLGADGLMAFQGTKAIRKPAVAPAMVRDRTGAGDVAAAGFLAGVLTSLDLEECVELAAICASRSIEGYGRSTYPDRELLGNHLRARTRGRFSRAEPFH
jgi:sugar/nucleoside kinase (ribokinase family)